VVAAGAGPTLNRRIGVAPKLGAGSGEKMGLGWSKCNGTNCKKVSLITKKDCLTNAGDFQNLCQMPAAD